MNHSITRNITPPIRGGVVTLRHCYGCYVTVTPIVIHDYVLSDSVTPKRLNVTPGVLRFFGQYVPGQGRQSVRFLENNGNYNARLASGCGLTANKSSGLIVL